MPKQKITYVDFKGKSKSKYTDKWTINDMLPVKEYKELPKCFDDLGIQYIIACA